MITEVEFLGALSL